MISESEKRFFSMLDRFLDSLPDPVYFVLETIATVLFSIFDLIINFGRTFPNTSQHLQLISIYCCAVIDLIYNILNNVFALGVVPEFMVPVFPLIEAILMSPILRAWTSPEKVFFLSYVVIELILVQRSLKFSKLVQYNVLLVFSLLMVQGLAISYWDFLFHRQITTEVTHWIWGAGMFIYTDREIALLFFLLTFLLFFALYCYLLFQSINGIFALIPNMVFLTDSVAFWLRIKTPTMRFGGRKGKGK